MIGSTLVGYVYGVAGPFWFAAGCSPMIVFFAVLGISCKRKIPEAHTLLEIIRIRYGKYFHSGCPLDHNHSLILSIQRQYCSCGIHDSLSPEQSFCCGKHAAWRKCCYRLHVSRILIPIGKFAEGLALGSISSRLRFCFPSA